MLHAILVRARHASAAAALAAVVCLSRPASGAACCVSSTSYGIGRLLIWEDFACGLQLGHARVLGQWDSSADYRRYPPRYYEGVSLAQPWAILRLHERIQAQAWVPVIINDRTDRAQRQIAGGLGDVGALARFELVAIGEYVGLPAIAFLAGGFAPTGRRVEETSPPLFAGTTGRGAWGGSLAVELEFARMPWFVRGVGGVALYAPFQRPDTGQRQQYGPLWQASFSFGCELVADKLIAALVANGEWEEKLKLDKAHVARSRAHLYSVAASLAWRVSPHWTLTATVHNSVWPDGGGMNRDARVGWIVGVRYGYF